MNIFVKKNYHFFILAGLAVLFFLVYSYLAISTPRKFDSPDETANYFFSQLYAQKGELRTPELLNKVAEDLIHPRSIKSVNGYLVPGSFLGLILIYGSLAKVFGLEIIVFLTPFWASISVLFFYSLIKKIFDQKIAFISSLLLFIHPAYWYFASRTMYPNILFVNLLIISFWFLVVGISRVKKSVYKYFMVAGGGFLMGLALITRTSEIVWVTLVLILIYYLGMIKNKESRWRRQKIWYPLTYLAMITIALIPVFYYNQFLYGHWLNTGYALGSNFTLIPPSFRISSSHSIISFFKTLIIPFGFQPKILLSNVYNYLIWFFWCLTAPAILGLFYWYRNRPFLEAQNKKNQQIYLGSFFLVFILLIFYYGNWQFFDHTDPTRITIGTSYVRYWLPLYLLVLPWVSLGLVRFYQKSFIQKALVVTLIVIIVVYSGFITVYATPESLAQIKTNIIEYKSGAELIQKLTPENSVIMTDRGDKIFFPERKVIDYSEQDPHVLKILPDLIKETPVYYYTELTFDDIQFMNEKRLQELGVKLVLIKGYLYKVGLIIGAQHLWTSTYDSTLRTPEKSRF